MLFQRRWPTRSKALLTTGIALAALAGLMARNYVRTVALRDPGPLQPAIVAAVPLAGGHLVEPLDLRSVALPARAIPPDAIADAHALIGRRTVAPVGIGEIFTPRRVSTGGAVASLVPPELRSLVIPSRLPQGIVAAGDRVDILATHTQGSIYTQTVAESVEVLKVIHPSAGSSFDQDATAERVALLVDAGTAEDIAQANATAVITLSFQASGSG